MTSSSISSAHACRQWLRVLGAALLASTSLTCSDSATESTAHLVPVISGITPDRAPAGSDSVNIAVIGSGFIEQSTIRWHASVLPTTYVSAARLNARVPADLLRAATSAPVVVSTPPPGGGLSNAWQFLVENPVPVLSNFDPERLLHEDAGRVITVFGDDFVQGSVVRWNGVNLTTAYVSPSQLLATVDAIWLRYAGLGKLTVYSAPPGGGTSNELGVPVEYPVPAITTLNPVSARARGSEFELTVGGSNFRSTSVIRINGNPRATGYGGYTALKTIIRAADLEAPGQLEISVSSPAPGGGISNVLLFPVKEPDPPPNPVPTLISLSPNSIAAGSPDFTLTLTGRDFVPGTVIQWDGVDRAATFISATALRTIVRAADVAQSGTAAVSVKNPTPGGGISEARPLRITLGASALSDVFMVELPTMDLAFDSLRQRIYVSVPATGGSLANTVTAIDPASGSEVWSIPLGSEPNKLGIAADGTFLYVGLDGEFSVQRIDLGNQTLDLKFQLNSDPSDPLRALGIAVVPGNPRSTAIARRKAALTLIQGRLAIYDDGLARPTTPSNQYTGADYSAPLFTDPTTLFALAFARLSRFTVSATGATLAATNPSNEVGSIFEHADGLLYTSSGKVVRGSTLMTELTFNDSGLVRPDLLNGRVFFLKGTQLTAWSLTSRNQINAVTAPSRGEGRLYRWGADGFAYRSPTHVIMFRTVLVEM